MPSRRVTVLVAAFLTATGGLWWRFAPGRASESDRALVRTLSSVARDRAPVALLSESDDVDRGVRAASREADAPAVTIVPRTPDAIEMAVRTGTLLAGPRGHEYLEVLGFEVAWLPHGPEFPSFPLARVRGRLRCAAVRGDAWSPLPGLEYTGRLGIVLPPANGGAILLVAGDDLPLDIDVDAIDGVPVVMARELLPITAAPPDYWIEGRSPRDAPKEIQQLTLRATADRGQFLSVRLGRRAPRVLARLRGYPVEARATVCAAPTGAVEAFLASTESSWLPADDDYFGTGWSDVMDLPNVGNARWMGRYGAMLVPMARRGAIHISLSAYRQPDAGDGELSLRINDLVDMPALPVREGPRRYEWTVPASAWVTGTNELLWQVSGAGAARLLAVQRVDLALVP